MKFTHFVIAYARGALIVSVSFEMGPVRARLRFFILNAVVDGTELDGKRVRLYSLKLKETAILTGALMAGPTRRRVVLPLSMIPLSEGIVEGRGTDGMCVSDVCDVYPWWTLGRIILVISTSRDPFFYLLTETLEHLAILRARDDSVLHLHSVAFSSIASRICGTQWYGSLAFCIVAADKIKTLPRCAIAGADCLTGLIALSTSESVRRWTHTDGTIKAYVKVDSSACIL